MDGFVKFKMFENRIISIMFFEPGLGYGQVNKNLILWFRASCFIVVK